MIKQSIEDQELHITIPTFPEFAFILFKEVPIRCYYRESSLCSSNIEGQIHL